MVVVTSDTMEKLGKKSFSKVRLLLTILYTATRKAFARTTLPFYINGQGCSPVAAVTVILRRVGWALSVRPLSLNLLPTLFGPLSLDLLLLVLFPHIVGIGLDPIAFCIFAGIDSYKEKKTILTKESGLAPEMALR